MECTRITENISTFIYVFNISSMDPYSIERIGFNAESNGTEVTCTCTEDLDNNENGSLRLI